MHDSATQSESPHKGSICASERNLEYSTWLNKLPAGAVRSPSFSAAWSSPSPWLSGIWLQPTTTSSPEARLQPDLRSRSRCLQHRQHLHPQNPPRRPPRPTEPAQSANREARIGHRAAPGFRMSDRPGRHGHPGTTPRKAQQLLPRPCRGCGGGSALMPTIPIPLHLAPNTPGVRGQRPRLSPQGRTPCSS